METNKWPNKWLTPAQAVKSGIVPGLTVRSLNRLIHEKRIKARQVGFGLSRKRWLVNLIDLAKTGEKIRKTK